MKRVPVFGILLLIPAVALFLAVGCRTDPGPGKTKTDGKQTGDNKTEKKKIAVPGDAKVAGVVKFKGTYKEEPETRIKDLKEAKDQADCMKGKGFELLKQEWLVGKDNGLANVVITIDTPDTAEYTIDEKFGAGFKDKKVELDQPHCAYVPHISAVYAGVQPFVIKNSAEFPHNANIKATKNESRNISMKAKDDPVTIVFKYEGTSPIDVSCQLHPFMNAKVHTFKHPLFAVTDKDGKFSIDGVPSGVELVVKTWHESTSKHTEFKKMTFTKGDNKIEGIEIGK